MITYVYKGVFVKLDVQLTARVFATVDTFFATVVLFLLFPIVDLACLLSALFRLTPRLDMSFSKSSHTITLSSDSLLSAKCRTCDGEWQDSSIRLNDFLGNEDGAFQLGDRDFSLTAKDAVVEQTEDCTVLKACLRKRDGTWQDASVELDAFISNHNGELCL